MGERALIDDIRTVGYGAQYAPNPPDELESRELAPYDSFGNGAAMRGSPASFLASSLDEALGMARRVTEVTHNHPEGAQGRGCNRTCDLPCAAEDERRRDPRGDRVRLRL